MSERIKLYEEKILLDCIFVIGYTDVFEGGETEIRF